MELNSQLPQQIESYREEIDKCNYHLNSLFDISRDIFGILDAEMILKNGLLFVLGNFGVVEGFIILLDLRSEKTIQFVSKGFQDSDIDDLESEAKKNLLNNNSTRLIEPEVSCGNTDLAPGAVDCVLQFKVDGNRVGMMGLGTKIISEPFTADEKKLLITLANNMVVALQNAKSYQDIKALNQDLLQNKERLLTTLKKLRVAVRKKAKYSKHLEQIIAALNVAQEVQQSLLPQSAPVDKRFDIAGGSLYCDETGGDYYDYIELPRLGPDVNAIAVGDVSGHGISSALLMAGVRAYLRSRVLHTGSLAEIITDVNRLVAADTAETSQFMALFFLAIGTRTRQLTWVKAGHDPVIVYSPGSDQFEELGGEGLPLGVKADWQYKDYSAIAKPGQILLLTTDGVFEAHNKNGDMFGKDRIKEVIRRNAGLPAEGIRTAITAAVDAFRGKTPQEDDITLVVLKLL
jgi:serine phosphatase RsbU (regulator of sigma subunit)